MSTVICPICQRQVNWRAAEPYKIGTDGTPQRMEREERESEESWESRLLTYYRPCGDVSQQETHFLPWDYADYVPITIGMIGDSGAGKTHLLAAMIYRLFASPDLLRRKVGIEQVAPLDERAHQRYVTDFVTPLIEHRRELAGTSTAAVGFCNAIKVVNSQGRSFAVTFFDLAGENLNRSNDLVRFYASANALIFVIDAAQLVKRRGEATMGDASFDIALQRLRARRKPSSVPLLPAAAAVVVAKADLIEFHDVIPGDWLAAGSATEEVDLNTVEQESEDAYIYLRTRLGASQWLRPARECHSSTLHFASATNGSASNQQFPGTFRQRRVLKPLLSVFAMTGILDEGLLKPPARERR